MAIVTTIDYILPRTKKWAKRLTGRTAFLLLYGLALTPLMFMILESLLGYKTFGSSEYEWGLLWMCVFLGLMMLQGSLIPLRLERVIGIDARAVLPIVSTDLSKCRTMLLDSRPKDLVDSYRSLRLLYSAIFLACLILILLGTLAHLVVVFSIDTSDLSFLPDLPLSNISVPSGSGVEIGALIGAAIVLAARFAWRVKAKSVDDSITTAKGGLVTYLRSFTDDEEVGKENSDDVAVQRVGIGFATSNSTFEGYALRTVRSARYLVTIADPKTRLPLLFANVVYARNDEWKENALRLIQSSEFVIVTLSASSGLDWEVEHILKGGHLQKVVFILPPTTKGARQARWNHFLEACRKFGVLQLPSGHVAADALTISFPKGIPPFVVRGPHDEFLAYDEAIVASLAVIQHQRRSSRESIRA